MTYAADFLKRLFRKPNIPKAIYPALNLIFIFVVINSIFALIADIAYPDLSGAKFLAVTIISSILIYGLGIIIALSPLGELLLRKKYGCKPISDQSILNRIMPLFNEIYFSAREIDPSITEDIKIFMNDDNNINAFAIGRKTICINKGLLRLSDYEIKGALAHEFGHISNRDADFTLVINIANLIINTYFFINWIVAMMYKYIMKGIGLIVSKGSESTGSFIIITLSDKVSDIILTVSIRVFSVLWNITGSVFALTDIRKNEYQADRFASDTGYGSNLADYLDRTSELKKNLTFKQIILTLNFFHPPVYSRINALLKNER